MKWEPIETAPKDGTKILLWANYANNLANTPFIAIGNWGERGGLEFWELDCAETTPLRPTHWMPLPAPPEKGT